MSGKAHFDYLDKLADTASMFIEKAREVSVIQFGDEDGSSPSVITSLAMLIALQHAADTIASELSSIENAINGS